MVTHKEKITGMNIVDVGYRNHRYYVTHHGGETAQLSTKEKVLEEVEGALTEFELSVLNGIDTRTKGTEDGNT